MAKFLHDNLRFALRKEASNLRIEIPINKIEQTGNFLTWPFYEFRSVVQTYSDDPRFFTVCITFFIMCFTSFLFYPSKTWDIMLDIATWIVDHINWSYVRFAFWFLSEMTILGLGIRAFGRFSNRKLMEYHGIVS